MPELPEVETIKRGLTKLILNKKIVQVSVLYKKAFYGEEKEILNKKIIQIRRFGKALIFDLSGGYSLMVHLRMTGQLVYVGDEKFGGGHPSENFVDELPNGQTRVVFIFDDESRLFFNDQRKFGFMKLIKTEDVETEEFISKLGQEPWEISVDELYAKICKKKTAIKMAILDQAIIAGLGNIYADESLFFAGVRPDRECMSLSRDEVGRIIEGAKKTMEDSLKAGGSTIRNYVKADGERGNFLDLFAKVYGRTGKKCVKCGGEILKIKLGGRGTHYCPRCQK